MACWNLDETDGSCKKTGNVCNDNEYNCPIAKHERRVAFAESRGGGSGGSGGSRTGTGTTVLIVLGAVIAIGGFSTANMAGIIGVAMVALGIFLKLRR